MPFASFALGVACNAAYSLVSGRRFSSEFTPPCRWHGGSCNCAHVTLLWHTTYRLYGAPVTETLMRFFCTHQSGVRWVLLWKWYEYERHSFAVLNIPRNARREELRPPSTPCVHLGTTSLSPINLSLVTSVSCILPYTPCLSSSRIGPPIIRQCVRRSHTRYQAVTPGRGEFSPSVEPRGRISSGTARILYWRKRVLKEHARRLSATWWPCYLV